MGKAEAGTPKDISNRMKLKGLQKLKFYCQMCKKQCRDQNGFTQHMKSETHVSNMRQFAENPNDFIGQYSRDFENDFMDLLKSRFNSKRIQANVVYKDFISDKQHVHMNSTRWSTLTGFIMHLHDSGKIEADNSERGLYITYIDKGIESMRVQREEEERMRVEAKVEKHRAIQIEREIQYAQKLESTMQRRLESKNEALPELSDPNQLFFSLQPLSSQPTTDAISSKNNNTDSTQSAFSFDLCAKTAADKKPITNSIAFAGKKELQAVDELLLKIQSEKKGGDSKSKELQSKLPANQMEQEDEAEDESEDLPWIQATIQVKIKDKELANGSYYNQKGTIVSVDADNGYLARVSLLNQPEIVINIDQEFLETVIPKLGGKVMLLSDKYLRQIGILESVDADNFEGIILLDGNKNQRVHIPYEFFSKI